MPREKTTTTTTTTTTYRQPAMGSFSSESSRGASMLDLSGGQAMIRMADAIVETQVTHTTRTTTSFRPIPIPHIPEPTQIPLPVHLPSEVYPLAQEPVPEDMRSFPLTLAGRKVVVREESEQDELGREQSRGLSGPGWSREEAVSAGADDDFETVGLVEALSASLPRRDIKGKGKERKRPLRSSQQTPEPGSADTVMAGEAVTPPATHSYASIDNQSQVNRSRSPPRKRSRVLQGRTLPQESNGSALLSPLPSPDTEHATFPDTARSTTSTLPDEALPSHTVEPSLGLGIEAAALFSLPAVMAHFDALPDKLQQHVLMHLFRRSRMPTIQRLSAFTTKALKRDFISLLPHEIAVQILKNVDLKGLVAASAVCRKWHRLVETERAVWRQRLIDEGLWYGLGAEEEAEESIRRRWETLDLMAGKKDGRAVKAGSNASDEEDMSPASLPSQRSTALKHVYRRRKVNDYNWMHRRPAHLSFTGHGTNVVTCLQFDADKIVSTSDDHSINIYETQTGHLRKRLDGHEGGVWALEYKGDTLVSGSTDRTVRVWDLETYKEEHVFAGHSSTVRCLQIVEPVMDPVSGEFQPPYPVIVTGSRDTTLRVWKLPKKGEPAYRRGGVLAGMPAERVPPDENPYHVHLLQGHTQAVRALAAHGRVCVSGSYDNTVRVWDIVTGTCSHVLTGHETKVYSIAYDWRRNQCASGSMDNTVKVWDVVTGECIHTLEGHVSLVGLVAISPSYLVSAAADASLKVWDADTGALQHTLAAHQGAITCFQHDETKVVSGSDGTLKLWDIKTGAFVRDLVTGISSVWQVQFQGSRLVAASNRNGNTVYDVFDFGTAPDPSGVDDDRLDALVRPAWERGDPREPLQYQPQLPSGDRQRATVAKGDGIESVAPPRRLRNIRAGAWPASIPMPPTSPTVRRGTRLVRFNSRGTTATSSRGRSMAVPDNETSPTPAPAVLRRGSDSFAPIFDETHDESGDDVDMEP